jgi:hypothetical protein
LTGRLRRIGVVRVGSSFHAYAFDPALGLGRRQRMGLELQCPGRDRPVYADSRPRGGFVTATMDLAMMSAAQGDCELVADLAAQGAASGLTSRHQIPYALMMRTTLTLDDDVAAVLERLRRSRRISLKRLINDALRRGLDDMGRRRRPRDLVRTRAVSLGRVRIAGIDNIGEALAIAEGESFK